MEQLGFVVAVDLGTSKIAAVLGRKNEQGIITILASEIMPSENCINYGVIYNINEAAGRIRKILNLLENKTGKKIGKIYVSIAGKSLFAIEHKESKLLESNNTITFALLDSMEQQAKLNKPDFFTNYSVVAPEYYLDGEYTDDPIEKTASTIEARYRLVIGRPNIKENIIKSIVKKCDVDIAGFIVGAAASGAFVLDESEREAGCALIDFGAGTTTLSVYKNGLLRYMSVIPFGGRTVTKDIKALGLNFELAETYKIKYGKLGKERIKRDDSSISLKEVDIKQLNKVIQLREDEIIINLLNQIQESGYAGKLDSGIIIIGGAAQLNGLADYLSEKLQMPVKKGTGKRVYINNAAELVQNPSFTQALSLLLFTNENCERKNTTIVESEVPLIQQQTEIKESAETQTIGKTKKRVDKKQKSLFDIFEKIQNFGGTMFKEENEE